MLSLAAISAGYGTFQVLFDVSLEVPRGEAVGVIGPNGAGKTTLMRVISGLVQRYAGAMSFDGRSIGGLPAYRMVEQGIAHVPENRRLFPRLTVEDNLRIGAYLPRARRQCAEQLDRVYKLFPRLKDRREQLAGTLSGGEQQMCAIGRALMSDPKLLLMDEPSAGLAPLVVAQVFDLVRRIRAEGLTVLIVEQNVQQVLDVVDRAYLLEVGRIKLTGTSAELKGNDFIRKSYMGLANGSTGDRLQRNGYLSSRGDHQRCPAGWRSRTACARTEPDIRRDRRGVDCLCRSRHVRHVSHLLSQCGAWLAVAACLRRRDRLGGGARRPGPYFDHRANSRIGPDQPA